MKISVSIKKRSNDDKIVKRRGVVWVINKKIPKHKRRQNIKNSANKLKKNKIKRKQAKRSVRSRK